MQTDITGENVDAPFPTEDLTPEELEDLEGAESAEPGLEETLRQAIQTLTDERDQIREQYLRSIADLQNFRRRAQLDRDEARKFGIQDLAESILPVLDNFERTVRALEGDANPEAIMQGVGMIEKQLRTAIEGAQVRRIISVGNVFDPALHEAFGTVETDEFEPNVVVEELEAGYQLYDRVIRPAKVRVATRPAGS